MQSVQSITAFNYKENNNQEKQYQHGIYKKWAVLLINGFAGFVAFATVYRYRANWVAFQKGLDTIGVRGSTVGLRAPINI